MSEYNKGISLFSTVGNDGQLVLSLKEETVPEPAENQVIVQVRAAPINPSDIAILLTPADTSTGKTTGEGIDKVYSAKLNPQVDFIYKHRVGVPLKAGNEAAGLVVKAGNGEAAQSLLGKTVSMVGGEMLSQYRCIDAAMCIPFDKDVQASEVASGFVNPLTALAIVETMKMDGFKALVHTAAASNLGRMLNRVCISDEIELVNIVRSKEQEEILRSIGAKIICNSSSDTFKEDLEEAIASTGAYLAFDAIGGGELIGEILQCMENAALRGSTDTGPYGSNQKKQVYVYGALNPMQTSFTRSFGFAWSISGWLLTPFLAQAGPKLSFKLRTRVSKEIKTTFASSYKKQISFFQLLEKEEINEIVKQSTGSKYLLNPSIM